MQTDTRITAYGSRTHKPQLEYDFQILIKYRRSVLFMNANIYVHICT